MKETLTVLESLLKTLERVLEKISKFKNSPSERFILQFMVMLFLLFVVTMGVYFFRVLPELIRMIVVNSV
jgi:hypothetical protein